MHLIFPSYLGRSDFKASKLSPWIIIFSLPLSSSCCPSSSKLYFLSSTWYGTFRWKFTTLSFPIQSNSAWALVVPLPYFLYCSRIKFKVETISYRHLFYIKMHPSDRRALPSISIYNSITSTTSYWPHSAGWFLHSVEVLHRTSKSAEVGL